MNKPLLKQALQLIANGGRPGTCGKDLQRFGLADFNLKSGWSLTAQGFKLLHALLLNAAIDDAVDECFPATAKGPGLDRLAELVGLKR